MNARGEWHNNQLNRIQAMEYEACSNGSGTIISNMHYWTRVFLGTEQVIINIFSHNFIFDNLEVFKIKTIKEHVLYLGDVKMNVYKIDEPLELAGTWMSNKYKNENEIIELTYLSD
jgi:hypothetical protein